MSKNYKSKSNRQSNYKRNVEAKHVDHEGESKIKKSKGYNDPSWYAPNEQILRDSASLSFNEAVGTRIGFETSNYLQADHDFDSAPGIAALDVTIGPGLSTSLSSPVNLASRNVYTFVRHKNSGHSNYDATSLMMYFLAMDSVYAYFNDLRRLYGVVTQYSIYNRYMPKAIVHAMGYNFNDVIANIPALRAGINMLANKINTRCVPSNLAFMIRHSWMFSNVYRDSNSEKSQLYLFRMANYYEYDEYSEPSKLVFKTRATMNVDTALEQVETMLSKIIESEDFNIMSGDVLKAYGEGNLFRVVGVEDEYTVRPVYNEEVLHQIHNATILGPVSGETGDIVDDIGNARIKWSPEFNISSQYGYNTNRILNIFNNDTSPANVMVSTRLMVAIKTETATGLTLDECGSEVITGCKIWYFGDISGVWNLKMTEIGYTISMNDMAIWKMSMLSKFDKHPMIIFAMQNNPGDPSTTKVDGFFFDLDTYTTVSTEVLRRMHQTALLGEFGITG